ncbi:hypothetical protein JG687_00017675 [Phytophthora cactorum]|nr:hypothetical protein Pcac1_g24938 [Phytophthora cactorum]KAG2799879.1 hypothetical protein PC111_g20225 [Phytophthora cactorum]KAG2806893.1 hypothetical protein PC112_g17645 [Phytophthora cactorum]KAG2832708.1 hypothetical protein PC113_g20701 [Phytophthora cactorum]KAG2878683.1 hypothetical protein PC114_g22964 [Phytophthora cactorum]
MDASDMGLCVLYPARKQFLRVRFDLDERSAIRDHNAGGATLFGMNTRELMSAVFAALLWGPQWSSTALSVSTHVRLGIDNVSVVAWNNKRSSRNPYAQLLLRLLALQEVRHNFYVSATHIAGVDNVMADDGSRAWESPAKAQEFANLSAGWTQVIVPPNLRHLSQVWERSSVQGLSQSRLTFRTRVYGGSGKRDVPSWDTRHGSLKRLPPPLQRSWGHLMCTFRNSG